MKGILSSLLELFVDFFSWVKEKKQHDEGVKDANLQQDEQFIKEVGNAKKTSDEINNLTHDQLREYNRNGVWDPHDNT